MAPVNTSSSANASAVIEACGGVTASAVSAGQLLNVTAEESPTDLFDPRSIAGTVVGFLFLAVLVLVIAADVAWTIYLRWRETETVDRVYQEALDQTMVASIGKQSRSGEEWKPHWTLRINAEEVEWAENRKLHTMSLILACVTLVVALIVFAVGFLAVDYFANFGLDSEANVLLELFVDDRCAKSAYAPVPASVISRRSPPPRERDGSRHRD